MAIRNERVAPPRGAAFDRAHHRVLVWYQDGTHLLFDSSGKSIGPQLPKNRYTQRGAFTADGRFIALTDPLEGLRLYDTTTGAKVAGPVREANLAVAISRDNLLVASTPQGELLFLDATTLEPRGPALPAGPGLSSADVEFSADGSLLTASNPGHAQLFDVAAHTPVGDPITQGGKTALRPDGHELAVATPTGTVLWDLDPQHWLTAACQVAGRNMTPQEWTTYIGDLAPYRQTCPAPA